MTKSLVAIVTGLVLPMPLSGFAAPDETQKQIIQRAQEAKQKLAAAQAATGAQWEKMLKEYMKLMDQVMDQVMGQVVGRLKDEHHLMMQGTGR